ncbi:hypothetical protein, partial [Salmonella sp. SAL4436]|uniref:hypothetical protein n=1 Tax=Salmonella sp. SAL4436 TaxID=3159891 RepID=UPI00397B00C9
ASTFGHKETGKLDLNNSGVQALVDRLRGPLQNANVSLSEQQLQDLANNIKTFRDSPPRSGVLRSIDDLQGVQGVTPQVLS